MRTKEDRAKLPDELPIDFEVRIFGRLVEEHLEATLKSPLSERMRSLLDLLAETEHGRSGSSTDKDWEKKA
jgi:hypothetical protein